MRAALLFLFASVVACRAGTPGVGPTEAAPAAAASPVFDVREELDPWIEAWNDYNLTAMTELFVPDARLTYYSSEKDGRLRGLEAIVEHHRGFGFVPGGKAPDPRKALWLDDLQAEPYGVTTVVTGTWFFGDRSGTGKDPQRGPVTFVFLHEDDRWRIAHAHFANAPKSEAPTTGES